MSDSYDPCIMPDAMPDSYDLHITITEPSYDSHIMMVVPDSYDPHITMVVPDIYDPHIMMVVPDSYDPHITMVVPDSYLCSSYYDGSARQL